MSKKTYKPVDLFSTDDLSVIRGLSEFQIPPRGAYIYFLSNSDEIVYVGKSIDIFGRVAAHSRTFYFDRVHYLVPDKEDIPLLCKLESAFIKTLRPAYNEVGKYSNLSDQHKKLISKYLSGPLQSTFGWENRLA